MIQAFLDQKNLVILDALSSGRQFQTHAACSGVALFILSRASGDTHLGDDTFVKMSAEQM